MEENQNQWVELVKSFKIPDTIKKNAIVALAKGIGNTITSSLELATVYFKTKSSEIEANSKARIKQIESASIEAAKLFKTNSDLADRALAHFAKDIISEQLNRESVARKTIVNLQRLTIIPEESNNHEIDDDWLSIFWKLAETKTKDDVQEILGKILSTEITEPKSISPNTLQLLSVLTSDIGSSFKRLCNISMDDGEKCFVLHPNIFPFQNIGPLEEYNIRLEDLFELDGANLIRSAETIVLNYGKDDSLPLAGVNIAGVKAEINLSGLQLHMINFTKSGRELRNLLELTPDEAYIIDIKNKYKDSIVIHR